LEKVQIQNYICTVYFGRCSHVAIANMSVYILFVDGGGSEDDELLHNTTFIKCICHAKSNIGIDEEASC